MAESNANRADGYQESQVNPVFTNYVPTVEEGHRRLFMKYAAGQKNTVQEEKPTLIPQTRAQLKRYNSGANLFSNQTNLGYNYVDTNNTKNLNRYGSGSNLLQNTDWNKNQVFNQYPTSTYKQETKATYIPRQTRQTVFRTSQAQQQVPNFKTSGINGQKVSEVPPPLPINTTYQKYPNKNEYRYNLFSMIDEPYNRCCQSGKCGSCPSSQCCTRQKKTWYN